MSNASTPMKILMVDDEQEFASTLAERLQLRGYSPTVVFDGESAIARVREDVFDLVLLDVMLPGVHGLTVLRRIREIAPDVPVVLVTGNTSSKDGIEGMKQGARAYINKPVDLQALLALFTEIAQEGRHG